MERDRINSNLFRVTRFDGGFVGNGAIVRYPDGTISIVTAAHCVFGADGTRFRRSVDIFPGRQEASGEPPFTRRGRTTREDIAAVDFPQGEGIPVATIVNVSEELFVRGRYHPGTGLPFTIPVRLTRIEDRIINQGDNDTVNLRGGEFLTFNVTDDKEMIRGGISGSAILNARGEIVGVLHSGVNGFVVVDGISGSMEGGGTALGSEPLKPTE